MLQKSYNEQSENDENKSANFLGSILLDISSKGQTLLGEDDFVDSLADHLRRHKDIPEIPKSQRFANRPELDKIFTKSILDDKRKRDKKLPRLLRSTGTAIYL